jgi:hypothetical protein
MAELKILDTDIEIKKMIFKAMSLELNKKIKANYKKAATEIQAVIPTWIAEQPEVDSLRQQAVPGSLNAQFGLPPGQADLALTTIVQAVADTIKPEVKFLNEKLKGFVQFTIQPSNFANLLGLGEGFVFTEPELHWLNWLLTQGSSPIVTGYQYEPGTGGRSGGGTMIGGQLWRVPPQFSGTSDNNFITRALAGRDKELTKILSRIIV